MEIFSYICHALIYGDILIWRQRNVMFAPPSSLWRQRMQTLSVMRGPYLISLSVSVSHAHAPFSTDTEGLRLKLWRFAPNIHLCCTIGIDNLNVLWCHRFSILQWCAALAIPAFSFFFFFCWLMCQATKVPLCPLLLKQPALVAKQFWRCCNMSWRHPNTESMQLSEHICDVTTGQLHIWSSLSGMPKYGIRMIPEQDSSISGLMRWGSPYPS